MEIPVSAGNRTKALVIMWEDGEGLASMRFALVEASPGGTLVVRGEDDDALRVILPSLTEYQCDEIMDLVTRFRLAS